MLITGIAFVLYPIIGNIVNVMKQNAVQDEYNAMVYQLNTETKTQLKEEAAEYNKKLAEGQLDIISTDEDTIDKNYDDGSGYTAALNAGNDVLAIIKIPKIDIELPIYRGTNAETLEQGIGHLRNTSLPVGGESSHCVLTGHTGLPRSMLFTDLNKLEYGDMFYIQFIDEIHAYKVDQIKIVEPYDSSDLGIIDGKDYITLLTCYPYGINSHRLLVRGERTAFDGKVIFNKTGKIENITEKPVDITEIKTEDTPIPVSEKRNMIDEFLQTEAKVNVYGKNINLWAVLIIVVLIITGIIIWLVISIVQFNKLLKEVEAAETTSTDNTENTIENGGDNE
ncbi:MAG: class C sortase [Clostridia bacterium]|nr:class C sortase [Clostridia bacterium]MBQ2153265.1 class C sortase [Clostridia bacterium]MBQ2348207.1 class C sortase [Clostridia bacterium]